jgi:hypothetical protein
VQADISPRADLYRLGTLRFDIPRRNDAMSAVIRAAMQSRTTLR